MAYYNGFPATYNQMYPQYTGGAQMPVFGQQMPGTGYQQPGQMIGAQVTQANQQFSQQQAQPQMMTPPTIRAEIIQVDDEGWEDYVDRFPVNAGTSQMFMTRSETKVIIKTMGQTGPLPLTIFDKRPPAPPAPVFNPGEYVRIDELDERVAAILAAKEQGQTQRPVKRTKKEETDDGTV